MYLFYQKRQNQRLNTVEGIVLGFAHHAQMDARENAKAVKAVVRMDVRQLVVAVVVKDVKDDVMRCAKAIASLAVRSRVTAYVAMHA